MERASATDMPMPASRRLVSTSGSARPIIFNSGTPLQLWAYSFEEHYEFIDQRGKGWGV